MSEFQKKLESLSSIEVLAIGIVIGAVIVSSAFYAIKPFQVEKQQTGKIEVLDARLASQKIGTGQRTKVLVTVKNTGRGARTQSLKLKIDGDVKKTSKVTLAPGENTQHSIVFRENKLGTHTLKIGRLAKNFKVLDHNIFTSQRYGFSFPYPIDWTLNKRPSRTGLMISLRENKTKGFRPEAQTQVSVQRVTQRTPSLENFQKTISNQVENNENLSWVSKPKITETDNIQKLSLAVKMKSGPRIKMKAIRGGNFLYNIQASAQENNYPLYKKDINMIIENFKLMK